MGFGRSLGSLDGSCRSNVVIGYNALDKWNTMSRQEIRLKLIELLLESWKESTMEGTKLNHLVNICENIVNGTYNEEDDNNESEDEEEYEEESTS